MEVAQYESDTSDEEITEEQCTMIFGVWKWKMIHIGKHQNVTVQLFSRTIYVSTLLVWVYG